MYKSGTPVVVQGARANSCIKKSKQDPLIIIPRVNEFFFNLYSTII